LVDHAHAAACHRAHRKLFVSGHTDLAHQKDIQIAMQRLGDLEPDRHSAPWERQYQCVWFREREPQTLRQFFPGFRTVAIERSDPHASTLHTNSARKPCCTCFTASTVRSVTSRTPYR